MENSSPVQVFLIVGILKILMSKKRTKHAHTVTKNSLSNSADSGNSSPVQDILTADIQKISGMMHHVRCVEGMSLLLQHAAARSISVRNVRSLLFIHPLLRSVRNVEGEW